MDCPLGKGLLERKFVIVLISYSNVTNFLTGGAAGIAGTMVSYPFDVVRTRLVAQGEPKFYQSTRDAVSKIWKNEVRKIWCYHVFHTWLNTCHLFQGYAAFFKGVTPTFATIAPYSGAQFGFYTLFTQLWNRMEKLADRGCILMPFKV